MDVIALVQLPLQVRQANHHCQILPDIAVLKFESFANIIGRAKLCARHFVTFRAKNALAFEPVEVLGEAATICTQKVPLHQEHEKRVNFIERVEDAEKVAGMTVGGDGK
jgi:hypothetical protein